jgi:hypothetical protein
MSFKENYNQLLSQGIINLGNETNTREFLGELLNFKENYNKLLTCGFISFENKTLMEEFLDQLPESIKNRLEEINEENCHIWLEV